MHMGAKSYRSFDAENEHYTYSFNVISITGVEAKYFRKH